MLYTQLIFNLFYLRAAKEQEANLPRQLSAAMIVAAPQRGAVSHSLPAFPSCYSSSVILCRAAFGFHLAGRLWEEEKSTVREHLNYDTVFFSLLCVYQQN